MGPHFFKCGKNAGNSFNGAALFQVRKEGLCRWRRPMASALQWGRTFSSAERSASISQSVYQGRRFNGAALFQVRKEACWTRLCCRSKWLQWGRTFSSAESSLASTVDSATPKSFNGAALFQVRKERSDCRLARFSSGFNGAALFQVRKGDAEYFEDRLNWAASMGPHFFKCGKLDLWCARCMPRFGLQWGRTFSSAERTK